MTKKARKREPRADRPTLSTRTSQEVRHLIDAAAKKSGRSVAQEAEHLLETALAPEGPWNAAFGGKRVREIAILMAAAFQAAGHRWAGDRFKDDRWVLDADGYKAGMFGVMEALYITIPQPLTREEVDLRVHSFASFLMSQYLDSLPKKMD